MAKWDYTHLKYASLGASLLWVLIFCLAVYKLVVAGSLEEFLIWCAMLASITVMLGYIILWWGNRPD